MKRLLEEDDVTDLERVLLRSVEGDEAPADGADRLFSELMNRSEARAPVVALPPRKRIPSWVWLAAAVLFGVGVIALDRSREGQRVKIVEETPTSVPTTSPVPVASTLPPEIGVDPPVPSAAPSYMVKVKPAPSSSGPTATGKGKTPAEALQKALAEADAGTTPPTSGAAFSKRDAAAGLGKLDARACAGATGPDGGGHLSVTFATDGSVQTVVVDPPFQGTARGGCMADQARAVRVPPFGGTPVRVGKSFVFNP